MVIVILEICDEDEDSSLVQQRMDGLANPSETKRSAHCKKVGISWMLRYYKAFLLLAFYSSDFAVSNGFDMNLILQSIFIFCRQAPLGVTITIYVCCHKRGQLFDLWLLSIKFVGVIVV